MAFINPDSPGMTKYMLFETRNDMKILWKYLKLQQWIIILSLALAAISQLLNLIDPIIFGKIIDDYATQPDN